MAPPPRIRRMLTAVFIGRVLMAARQIVVVPLMIRAWGTSYYGAWLILSSIPTFMALSNLGIGTSARTQATLEVAGGRTADAMTTIRLGVLAVAVVGTIVVALVYFFLQLFVKQGSAVSTVEHAHAVVAVLMVTTFVQMFAAPFDAAWVGTGRAAFAQNANNLLNAVTVLGMLGALWFGAPAWVLALVMLIITVIWSAIYVSLGRRTLRKLVLAAAPLESRPRSEGRLFIGLIWQGLGFQAGALWQAILFQGSIVVAGSVLGTTGAALWGAMRVVIRSGNQFLELIGQTVAPEFQSAYAQGNYDKLRKDYRHALTAAVISAGCFVLVLLIVGPSAFNWWTRNSFKLDYLAWSIFCVSLLPFSLWWCGAVLQGGVNRPWMINAYGVGSAALCVILMHLLGGGGIVYFSGCALLFDVMMAAFVLPQSAKLLRVPQVRAAD